MRSTHNFADILFKKIGTHKAVREYRNKQAIFLQGEPADAMYYIENGNVKLTVTSNRDKKAVIAILGQGDFFGEGCLVRRSLRTSTATAIQRCTIARVEKVIMGRVIHREPAFAEMVISYLLSRIIRVEEDFVDQLFNSSEKRLARVLVLIARFGMQSKPKSLPKISQATLAEMVGTTRSRVSYFMNQFRKRGFIHYNYNGGLQIHRALLSFARSH